MLPYVSFNDSGGARIQEGVDSLRGYGKIFYYNTLLSGVVPQIAVIAGPCAGGAAYSPALMDFIIMVQGIGKMFIAGPEVIKEATGEEITAEELGGAVAQAAHSGNVHFIARDDADAIEIAQTLLGYLPNNNTEDPPLVGGGDLIMIDDEGLNHVVPDDPREPYNMFDVLQRVFDPGSLFEVHAHYARNIIVSFARLNGRVVGIVANQPAEKFGAIDIDASDKASRFVRFCNAFNIPLISFVDVPGFLPGVEQEFGGWFRYSTSDPGTCNDTFGTRRPVVGRETAARLRDPARTYSAGDHGASAGQHVLLLRASPRTPTGRRSAPCLLHDPGTTPTVSTSSATPATGTSAQLNGSANPGGAPRRAGSATRRRAPARATTPSGRACPASGARRWARATRRWRSRRRTGLTSRDDVLLLRDRSNSVRHGLRHGADVHDAGAARGDHLGGDAASPPPRRR